MSQKFPILDDEDSGFYTGAMILGSDGNRRGEASCYEIFKPFQRKPYLLTRKTLFRKRFCQSP
jgi:hypothetical protein